MAHELSLSQGGGGVQVEKLLQDCVPSTFAAMAAVLPTLCTHHYCCWHVKDAVEKHLPDLFTDHLDLVDPTLVQTYRDHPKRLSTLLIQQRTIFLHSYQALILCRKLEDMAVLMQGFLSLYSGNDKVMRRLSTEPYNDLLATLCAYCGSSPAVNATTEVFFRLVRHLQCSAQGGRVKMRNEASALALLCHAMFQTVRAESDTLATSAVSLWRRAAVHALPPSPPPLHAAGPLLLGPNILGSLHTQGIVAVQPPQTTDVVRALQVVGACVPHTSAYGAKLYDMATRYSGNVRLTFASLVRCYKDGERIISQEHAKTFSEALVGACSKANQELLDFVNSVLAEGGAFQAATAVAPPPCAPRAVKRSFATLMGQGSFGSGDRQGGFVRQERVANASVHGSALLPNLKWLQGVGRPSASVLQGRAQWATVSDTGQQSVAITAENQVAIYRAYQNRPPCVTVILGDLTELVQRQPGVPFRDARAEDARTAPAKRSATQLAMLGAAMHCYVLEVEGFL